MKRKYLILGLFSLSGVYGFTQPAAKPFTPAKISKSAIQVVYAQYLQNGNHSAITGGTGTEKLQVYAPEFILRKQIDSLHAYTLDGGVDVISSASMDNIDFEISSASRVSKRAYISAGYEFKPRRDTRINFGASGHFSIESAYLSLGTSLYGTYTSRDLSTVISSNLEVYFDDLLWGRLNGERPLQLVYPSELRYKKWLDGHSRRSWNLDLGFEKTINARMILGIFPGIAWQHGILSTPYHRVYFTDSDKAVEFLPANRFKFPLGIQLNSFIGDRYILRTYYRFYADNFGITSHTAEIALGIRTGNNFTVTPGARLYTQTGSSWFKAYAQHAKSELYYTSDYDLSAFTALEGSLEARWLINPRDLHTLMMKDISARYTFYKRSDGLSAHSLSLVFGVDWQKKRNR